MTHFMTTWAAVLGAAGVLLGVPCLAGDARALRPCLTDDANTPIPAFTPSPFLRSTLGPQGAYLSLNGAPFRMLGYQASLGEPHNSCSWQAQDLVAAFDEMTAHSHANTVRIWFLQSSGGPPESGGRGWLAFDMAVAQAKVHGLRIIATLVNQWGDCEPAAPANQDHSNYKTVAWYTTGYKAAADGYPLAFRDYAQAVAARYANEPTIAFWQLVNEAEARDPTNGSCPDHTASANAIRAFADDMVDALHAVDANHLINLGTQDDGYCGVTGTDFSYIHEGKIDICEVHSYDAANPALPPLSASKITQCQALDKPIFMGEMGFCRNIRVDPQNAQNTVCSGDVGDPNVLAVTLQNRAQYFDARFRAGFAAGLSGMLIWEWSPYARDGVYGVFTGDPVEQVMQNY